MVVVGTITTRPTVRVMAARVVAVVVPVDLDELAKAESVVVVAGMGAAIRPVCAAGSQHSAGAWVARTHLEHTGMVQQEAQLATH